MADRQQQLNQLQSFIGKIDTEVTMILQHLQWDSKHLLEGKHMVGCKYDGNHRVPDSSIKTHEQQCLLNANGYSTEDVLLPDPLDTNSSTLIKFNQVDISQIINKAAASDLSFKKEHAALEPLSLERLQERYTADERRALHDAVVAAAPSCHDLSDLALLSDAGETSTSRQQKSRAQILAELRDMKRRRTKYRVAAKTRNYSDVLRDVIKTQMEVYTEVKVEETFKEEDPSRRHEGFKVEQRLPSKYPISSSYRSSHNDESHNIHSKHGPKEWSKDNIDTSSKRRWNEFDKNTDCSDRTFIEENYYDDDRQYASKRSRTKYNEESSISDKYNYKGRKHREGTYYDDSRQSASKTTRTKYSEESSTSDRKDYKDRKYYEDDKRSDGKRTQFKDFEEYPASERSYYKGKMYREKYEKDRSYSKIRHGDVETERESGRTKYKEDREEQRRSKKRLDEERYRSDRKHEKSSHRKKENRDE